MATKKTLKDYFTELLEQYDLSDEHKDFIKGRLDALAKKTTERKPTATQLANEKLANAVYEQMVPNRLYTVSQMMKTIPAFAEIDGLSQSKANSIVKKLKDSGKVKRTESKGVAYFEKVEIDE